MSVEVRFSSHKDEKNAGAWRSGLEGAASQTELVNTEAEDKSYVVRLYLSSSSGTN